MRITACVCLLAMFSGDIQMACAGQARPQVAGVIEVASHAELGGAAALPGSTVYSGDVLDTDVGGALQLRANGAQLSLAASTEAKLSDTTDAMSVSLTRGSVRFFSPADRSIAIETQAGTLRGENGYAASGMITINNPFELVISAYDQNLVLDNDGELHLIEAGKSYRVAVSDYGDADAVLVPPKHKRRRKIALYLIGGAAAVSLAFEVWQCLTESPDTVNGICH